MPAFSKTSWLRLPGFRPLHGNASLRRRILADQQLHTLQKIVVASVWSPRVWWLGCGSSKWAISPASSRLPSASSGWTAIKFSACNLALRKMAFCCNCFFFRIAFLTLNALPVNKALSGNAGKVWAAVFFGIRFRTGICATWNSSKVGGSCDGGKWSSGSGSDPISPSSSSNPLLWRFAACRANARLDLLQFYFVSLHILFKLNKKYRNKQIYKQIHIYYCIQINIWKQWKG